MWHRENTKIKLLLPRHNRPSDRKNHPSARQNNYHTSPDKCFIGIFILEVHCKLNTFHATIILSNTEWLMPHHALPLLDTARYSDQDEDRIEDQEGC